ncbi:efflux RND transporter periplasmic adaptor subunit [Chelatococcus reniformis]|nr:efflux RND transporter periplasmic adaptor subunit [Chelatococcus reniformis]
MRIALAGAAVAALVGCNEKNAYVPPPPATVTIAQPVQKPVTVYAEFTGNTAAVNAVDLEARVQGFLVSINYKDGQPVKKGQLLFGIEKDQYQAQLDLQKAELASAQAKQTNAQLEYNRQAQLGRQDFASQKAVDDAKTNLDAAVAQVAADKANVQVATINLGYTAVTAPFDGVVTRHLVDVGALVGYSGPTKLATIVQINPIYVYFNVSEQQVLTLREGFAKQGISLKELRENNKSMEVEIALQTETEFKHKGKIDYIAPQIDPNTGTLQIRGIFDNPNFELLPGLFVRVRVPVNKLPNALLVDDAAIGSNQVGSYVMVVNKDNIVEQRQIKPGQLDGQLRVISDGLQPGDQVVVGGVQRAIPGNKVAPQQGQMARAQAPAPAAPPAATPAAAPAAAPAKP